MADINSELSSNQTLLVLMSSSNYNTEIVNILKSLKGKVLYDCFAAIFTINIFDFN